MSTAATAPPLEVTGLTKRFGAQTVVEELSFAIEPGRVTGFLGPNGSGKTTTLRMAVGLAAPTSGEARLFGVAYADLPEPSRAVGTLIDASAFHPGRRARHELLIHAATAGLDDDRVPEVLAQVGLEFAADKRVSALSLGMRQRLGLAAALLGRPQLLILDEPANGLDPAGMHWLRALLRELAAGGTAVFVSSHVLSELALFADDVVVIDHGRLVVQSSLTDLVARGTEKVHVRTPNIRELQRVLDGCDAEVDVVDDSLVVVGVAAETVGELAAGAGVVLHQLRTEIQTLEEIFLDLTADAGIR